MMDYYISYIMCCIPYIIGDEDSLVDMKEIEKRINHCGFVRKNTVSDTQYPKFTLSIQSFI